MTILSQPSISRLPFRLAVLCESPFPTGASALGLCAVFWEHMARAEVWDSGMAEGREERASASAAAKGLLPTQAISLSRQKQVIEERVLVNARDNVLLPPVSVFLVYIQLLDLFLDSLVEVDQSSLCELKGNRIDLASL